MRAVVIALAAVFLGPLVAAAQHVVAYDTLGDSTPGAVTCGFCAGEKFGVLFYDVPGGGGLAATDFPFSLDTLRVAVAEVTVSGASSCNAVDAPVAMPADLAVYSGATAPSDIATLPADDVWPGETLVWSATLMLDASAASTPGHFEARFNTIDFAMTGDVPVVPDGQTYLRVVVTMHAGGTSSLCASPAEPPGVVPIRDDDGVVGTHRDFIYARAGTGGTWFWNESVPGGAIHGDWAIRLEITSTGSTDVDAGAIGPMHDAGSSSGTDAGAGGVDGARPDGGGISFVDAGGSASKAKGCSCRVIGARSSDGRAAFRAAVLASMLVLCRFRRRRARA